MLKLSLAITEFLVQTKLDGYRVTPLTGDASDRKYYRLKHGKQSYVLMDSSRAIESMASFVKVDKYLSENNFSVPRILDIDSDNGLIILEDFGAFTLDQYLQNHPDDLEKIYGTAIELITSLSTLVSPPFPEFDKQFFFQELSAFSTWYVPYIGKTVNDADLNEFKTGWHRALEYLSQNDRRRVFVHKDLHCGNLFWLPDRPGIKSLGLIDFQKAKSGSEVYDLTSFLYDCRFRLPPDLRNRLILKFLSDKGRSTEKFNNLCDIYIAQRNIKILGNFAFISRQKRNPNYLKFLPQVRKFVHTSLRNPILKDVRTWFLKHDIR